MGTSGYRNIPQEPHGTRRATGYHRIPQEPKGTTGATGNFMSYTGYHMNYRIPKDLKSIPHAPPTCHKSHSIPLELQEYQDYTGYQKYYRIPQ